MEISSMKLVRSIVGFVALVSLSGHVVAGVYKCTDADGKTAYQSAPCAEAASALKIDVKTGGSTDLAAQLKRQEQEVELKKLQEIEHQKQLLREASRIKKATEQSGINQQLIKDNPIQFTAFAIPPYRHDRLSALVQPFAARLPEIEQFRRLAAQKALATGECKRVESGQLSIQSQMKQLVFTIDCSSAKTFQFNEAELIK